MLSKAIAGSTRPEEVAPGRCCTPRSGSVLPMIRRPQLTQRPDVAPLVRGGMWELERILAVFF